MAKKKLIKNDAQSELVMYFLEDLPGNEALASPPPSPKFLQSILRHGVIMPLIATTYRSKLYLIDGRRRLKAARIARDRTIEDPTWAENLGIRNGDTSHLNEVAVRLYKGISPDNRNVWSHVLNEDRSDNPLGAYYYLSELRESKNWEEITAFVNGKSATAAKILSLDNLVDQQTIFEAYENGKVAASTMFAMAKLEAQRQNHLLDILKEKEKLTGQDIKEVKTARTAQALASIPYPKEPVNTADYIVFAKGDVFGPFADFPEALTESHNHAGSAVYKKVG